MRSRSHRASNDPRIRIAPGRLGKPDKTERR
jgi:hypothetical protein